MLRVNDATDKIETIKDNIPREIANHRVQGSNAKSLTAVKKANILRDNFHDICNKSREIS